MPKLSVIIPCYNYAHFLQEAVESVIGQTYRDLEIIIVNDGSPDNTREVALCLIEKYGSSVIRLIDQKNSGLPTARNAGIKAARGEYILPLDADDLLKPTHLEKLVAILESNPEIGLVYSWSEKFGMETGMLRHGEFTLRNLLVRDGPPQSPLFRKSAWEKVDGYNPAMRHGGEDWEFSCSLYEAGYKGKVVPEALFLYRRHGPSMIENMVNHHAIESSMTIKLLHPRLFEPALSRISPRLAKSVIWLKSWTRDPISHYIYVRFPSFHERLRDFKYGRMDSSAER